MFVQKKPWSERRQNRIFTGKVHWMSRPWETICGMPMNDDQWVERTMEHAKGDLCAWCAK